MSSDYGPAAVVGQIESADIRESSGLSASECQDVLWTHNDAGGEPIIFAMGLTGKHLGAWKLPDVNSVDWESIATFRDASGKCLLLIGDIGDNDEKRRDLAIYRIPEPVVSEETSRSSAASPLTAAAPEVLRFTYAGGPANAETLLVHPTSGFIYIVTKVKKGPAAVHKLEPRFGGETAHTTANVADISVPAKPEGLITGGSFSPDGKRVMLCDVKNGYELVLPDGAADPDAIWTQRATVVDLGERKQGEGVSYGRDGRSVYASSERKNTPITRIERK